MSTDTTTTLAHELVVIDGALPGLGTLVASAVAGRQVLVLDPGQDGVAKLAEALSEQSGLTTIHVLSHGGPGLLQLGTARLDETALPQYADALATIGSVLADTGDLLRY